MSENLDNLYRELKSKHYISLYYNRVMVYDEGLGELQFWSLSDSEDNLLCINNKGTNIYFNKWEFSVPEDYKSTTLSLYIDDKLIAKFKMPRPNKIISNHNNFYVEEFAKNMIIILEDYTKEKGDWADLEFNTVMSGLERNFNKIKNITSKEEFEKTCLDIANYSMMAKYLFNTEEKQNG